MIIRYDMIQYGTMRYICNVLFLLCWFKADGSSRENGGYHGDRDVDIDEVSSDVYVPGRVVLNLWRILNYKVPVIGGLEFSRFVTDRGCFLLYIHTYVHTYIHTYLHTYIQFE